MNFVTGAPAVDFILAGLMDSGTCAGKLQLTHTEHTDHTDKPRTQQLDLQRGGAEHAKDTESSFSWGRGQPSFFHPTPPTNKQVSVIAVTAASPRCRSNGVGVSTKQG